MAFPDGGHMRRREFLGALSGSLMTPLALPPVAGAQQRERVRVVGLLTPSDADGRRRALLPALEKLGYREGGNLVLEVRSADGKLDRLQGLAAELVRSGVDVIVTVTTPGTQAVIDTASKIPIVMALVG